MQNLANLIFRKILQDIFFVYYIICHMQNLRPMQRLSREYAHNFKREFEHYTFLNFNNLFSRAVNFDINQLLLKSSVKMA